MLNNKLITKYPQYKLIAKKRHIPKEVVNNKILFFRYGGFSITKSWFELFTNATSIGNKVNKINVMKIYGIVNIAKNHNASVAPAYCSNPENIR